MWLRAFAVWLLILVCAIANGAVRDTLVVPSLGDTIGRGISSLLLAGVVVLVARFTIRWIRPTTEHEARLIGAAWLFSTLAFEFLIGHFVMRTPWAELLIDYNVVRGRIWLLVLLATALAPAWAYEARRR